MGHRTWGLRPVSCAPTCAYGHVRGHVRGHAYRHAGGCGPMCRELRQASAMAPSRSLSSRRFQREPGISRQRCRHMPSAMPAHAVDDAGTCRRRCRRMARRFCRCVVASDSGSAVICACGHKIENENPRCTGNYISINS